MRAKPQGKASAEAPATLVERLGGALFSGLLALGLGLGLVLWLLLNAMLASGQYYLPFRYVEWFAAAMAVFGFALNDNVVASVIGWMFEMILLVARSRPWE